MQHLIWTHKPTGAEVNYLYGRFPTIELLPLTLVQKVFELEISVHDVTLVHVYESSEKLPHKLSNRLFIEILVLLERFQDLSALAELREYIEEILLFEYLIELQNVRMVQVLQHFQLCEHILLIGYVAFPNYLHRSLLSGQFAQYLVHRAVAPLTQLLHHLIMEACRLVLHLDKLIALNAQPRLAIEQVTWSVFSERIVRILSTLRLQQV